METLSFSLLMVLLIVVFSNFANGTLGDWAKAKFLNAGAPNRNYAKGALATADRHIPAGSHSTPDARGYVCPVPGATVGGGWGVPRTGHTHQGQDLMAPAGTPVGAVTNGRVTAAGQASATCGLRVHLRHSGGRESVYCHLNTVTVQPGQAVRAGQTIGTVGNTGNAADTASHLHFEMWSGGHAVDPAAYLPSGCGGS